MRVTSSGEENKTKMSENHIGEPNDGSQLLRRDLANYTEASNLSMNEKIQEAIRSGEKIYHLGFGQSPFPVPEKLKVALQDNAYRNEYLSIAGEVCKLKFKITRFPTSPTII